MTNEPMHIERVEVTNFKRIESIDVDTAGEAVVTIGGNNAQGKSSMQDAIWNTLGGKQKAVEMPIRAGETKASSRITLSAPDGTGLVATRTWKGDRSTLTLQVKGAKANLDKPQEILDGIIGDFAFDPMAFATMPEKKRRDTLAEVVGVDVSELDHKIADIRAERLLTGRDRDRVKGALDEAEPPAANLPDDFLSLQGLIDERDGVTRIAREIAAMQVRREEIAAQIEKLQAEHAELMDKQAKGSAWLSGRRDPEAITADIASIESTNAAIHAASEYRRLKESFEAYDKLYDDNTDQIKALEIAKAAVLAETTLPVEGLSFDDESVYYNGVPFSQASAAERIRISVGIAVAMNPTLRVVCVKDATLMDAESLALLKGIAAEHDVQLFLEMVGDSGDYTVVLEDGSAK